MAVLDGRLTREESKEFFQTLDSDGDGDIEVFEVQNAIKGDLQAMEDLVIRLLHDVPIPMPTKNFPDFMLFLARRKKSANPMKEIFQVICSVIYFEISKLLTTRNTMRMEMGKSYPERSNLG